MSVNSDDDFSASISFCGSYGEGILTRIKSTSVRGSGLSIPHHSGVLGLSINVSRLKRLSYEGHQVIVFISTTKNQRVEAAAAVLDPEASIVPAIMPMIQSIPAIVYLHISSHVKHRIKAR